jgi:hypothetical protein
MIAEQKKKTTFLIFAFVMFIMIPIYHFMIKTSDLEWIFILLFLAVGILCVVNSFIIQMKQAELRRNQRGYSENKNKGLKYKSEENT